MLVLITALCAGSSLAAMPPRAMDAAPAAVAAASAQAAVDTTFAVSPNGRLVLDVMNGTVSVTTWDRNAVRVSTRGAPRRLSIRHRGNRVEIEPDDAAGWRKVDLEIVVPRRYNVDVEGVNLTVRVDGVQGSVSVENVEGTISISRVTGPVAAESVSGDVALSAVRGDVAVSTTNRAVRLDDIRGDVEAETVNGSISMRRIDAVRVEASTVQGIVEYEGTIRSGGSYYLGTHNGRITFAVPEQTSARINVETQNGKVESSFPVQIRSMARGEHTIVLGSGSARVQLESFNGSVYLVRPGSR